MSLRFLLAPSIGAARARARAELLTQSVAELFGERVEIVTAESYQQLSDQALDAADLVWAPPALCVRLAQSARAIYRAVRHGRGTYRSALIVRKNGPQRIADLEGAHAVWVDRLSIGGHLLARAYLLDDGIDPDAYFASQHFVGSYPDAIREVLYGRAHVTAISVPDGAARSVEESLASYGGNVAASELRSIAVTSDTPNDALVLTGRLSEERAEALAARVFGTPDAKKTPASLCLALEAEAFERATPADYARIAQLIASAPAPHDAA